MKSYDERQDGFPAGHWLLTRVADPRVNDLQCLNDGYKLGKKFVYRLARDVYADDDQMRSTQGNVAKKGKSTSKVRERNKYKNLPDKA